MFRRIVVLPRGNDAAQPALQRAMLCAAPTSDIAVLDVVYDRELIVRKVAHIFEVPCCLLTDDTGENHCQHPQPPLVRRLRWRIRDRWSCFRLRLGSWIAGVDLDERDDW